MDRRKLLIINNDFLSYRKKWLHTIYVATTGNDTTGNGSKLNPYLTLKKALTIAVAGDGILLANGTYSENSGSGWFDISKNVANWIVIEPELGQSGSVTVTSPGTSTYTFTFASGSTSSYLHFKDITLLRGGTSDQFFRLLSASLSNIKFQRCTFAQGGATYGWYNNASPSGVIFDTCTFTTAATAGHYQVYGVPKGLTFTNCSFTNTNSAASRGIYTTTTTSSDALVLENCTITGGKPIEGNGGTYTVTNCTIVGTGAASTVVFGVDGQTGNTTIANINNCSVSNTNLTLGHVLLFGAGCLGGGANNVTISSAFDYTCVVKECTNVEIQNCNFVGGSSAALYFKAAAGANAHNNTLTVTTGYGFQLLRNEIGGNRCSNWQFQNNTINANTSGKALNIGTATDDAGGGVCDYNAYQSNSGLGKVRADTNVANLTELQAAWADYDVPTNDSHSTVF